MLRFWEGPSIVANNVVNIQDLCCDKERRKSQAMVLRLGIRVGEIDAYRFRLQ